MTRVFNELPPSFLHPESQPGPVFRIGLPHVTTEYIEEGKRLFLWSVNPGDQEVASLAGWGTFPWAVNGMVGSLEIPYDTRSASSALGGTEAWVGEKDQILNAMALYANNVYQEHRVIDTNLQLDSMGVTRGNDVLFMAPPHNLTVLEAPIARSWYDALVTDIDEVLSADPRREELVGNFKAAMAFIGEAQ